MFSCFGLPYFLCSKVTPMPQKLSVCRGRLPLYFNVRKSGLSGLLSPTATRSLKVFFSVITPYLHGRRQQESRDLFCRCQSVAVLHLD
jgi:hypothetical protein